MIDFNVLAEAMGDLDEDKVVENLTQVMDEGGSDAQKALDACQKGMDIVGNLFEDGEYYVGDLIYAGELMTKAVEILKGLAPYYEKHHGAVIEESAIEAAVAMSIRYINDRFLPDKAIDLLDEAASKVQLAGYKTPEGIVQTENHLRRIYAAKEEAKSYLYQIHLLESLLFHYQPHIMG